MDKKSLLCGMAIGGAIAIGGMILGGQGVAAQPLDGQPGVQQANVARYDKLVVREIEFQNTKGHTVMLLKEQDDLASMQIWNGAGQELVRIGGVLRGGGQIMTFEDNRPIVQLTSVGQGGAIKIQAKAGETGMRLSAWDAGPAIEGLLAPGKLSFDIPKDREAVMEQLAALREAVDAVKAGCKCMKPAADQ